MKVAVLTARRSGSMSLFHASQHIQNFSTGHDTREGALASERAILSDNHIEFDTRFAWMLGRLAEQNPDDTYFVFLTRDARAVATSYNRRWQNRKGIMRGYCETILQRDKPAQDTDIAIDLVETIETNIRAFLSDKRHSVIRLEYWQQDVPAFFNAIEAEVDETIALAAFAERHNASRGSSVIVPARFNLSRLADTAERALKKMRSR